MSQTTKNNLESRMERAYSAFMGTICGDAAGSTLEFFRGGKITEKIALNAMKMPGGGQLQVGAGQFTDDSECAIGCLAFPLHDKDPKDGFPINEVAQGYSEWFASHPFDIGGTCARAFSTNPEPKENLGNRMMYQACKSTVSEANGAAMRCCPIAIWSVGEPIDVIVYNAKTDCLLSHPSQVCQDVNAIIVLAIEYLIRNAGDNNGCIEYLDNYITYNVHTTKVRDWYFKDSLDISELDCTKNIGWVKWGFILTIYYLRNNTPYETAIKEVLMKGGDVDTNAAIVGSVISCLHKINGPNGIPKYMLEPVLAFDPTNPGKGHKRPAKYSASNIYSLTYQLLTHEIAKKR